MDTETTEVCDVCQGRRFVTRLVGLDHRDFGKAFPCPVCVTREREAQDWFAGLKVTEHNEQAIRYARKFAQVPTGWLVLVGTVGTGKTTLAKAVLSHWRGKEHIPPTAAMLLNKWRGHIRDEDFEGRFLADADAPVAVLDDLGAEKVTDWTADRLTQYLDWRYIRRQPTLITTNCDRERLISRFQEKGTGDAGERIADRVFDEGTDFVRVVTITGPSWRQGGQDA